MLPEPDVGWVVVVPVKTLAAAKSRLAELTATQRAELALAMALDAVDAVLEAAVGVVVVTSDTDVVAALTARHGERVLVVPDTAVGGLNQAARDGIDAAARWRPAHGIAVLLADLPALRAAELRTVLDATGSSEVIAVADTDGTGTTMLASYQPRLLRPNFGADSFARHVAAGARGIGAAAGPGLRRDVDRLADLDDARALGVGSNTAALIDIHPAHGESRHPMKDAGPRQS